MSNYHESHPWTDAGRSDLTPAMQSQWQEIRSRLESQLPKSPYYTRQELAVLIRVEGKTLANDRSPSGAKAYPLPVRIGRQCVYPRHDVLDWLAHRELESRARRIHRCL